MIIPLAKEIKVEQLQFSEEIHRRLASLAMAVELREQKRFSVSKTIDILIELINFSSKSANPEIKSALSNLMTLFNSQQKSLLIGFGTDLVLSAEKNVTKEKSLDNIDKKYLNGARG